MRLVRLATISVLAVVMAVFTPHVLRTESTWQAAACLVMPAATVNHHCCAHPRRAATPPHQATMSPGPDPPADTDLPDGGALAGLGDPAPDRTQDRLLPGGQRIRPGHATLVRAH